MAWCFSTRASVATVLTTHPCVSRCLRVKARFELFLWDCNLMWCLITAVLYEILCCIGLHYNSQPTILYTQHFQMHCPWKWKLLCLDWSFSEICSHRCYWQLDSIGSFNGLAPNRQQSIIGGNVHPRPTMLYRINRLGWVNSSFPRQNGSHLHLADNIFRCIFVNEKFCILIKISLKFVPKGPIDNRSALV